MTDTDTALRALPTTSPDLFHGHHPACSYTIEGDPKACDCEVRLRALAAAEAAPLDVERLARALRRLCPMDSHDWPEDAADHELQAQDIARAYAAEETE